MNRAFAGLAALSLALITCGDPAEPEVTGHALTLDVALKGENGQLAFLTPSNTITFHPASALVGKPYLIATFHSGFSPGNDPPIDHEWGVIPDDLTIRYTTEKTYDDGPYDIVFIGYVSTEITPEIKAGPVQSAPAAKGGDLASFTLSTDEIREGDPTNALGTLRLNVEGADASVALENRTPADPSNGDQALAAFTNTILVIP